MLKFQDRNASALMSAYNYCKHWADRTGLATTDRVDRALGYLMTGEAEEKWDEYGTRQNSCGCPDHQFRGTYCKHILSLLVEEKYREIMQVENWPMAA